MGSYCQGRKQVQILNRHDAVFSENTPVPAKAGYKTWDDAVRSCESQVRKTLDDQGSGGSFRLQIDHAPRAEPRPPWNPRARKDHGQARIRSTWTFRHRWPGVEGSLLR